jgi:murein DD-endopeptidase MepM/ murein hydrolase activator NlpD
MGILRVTLVFFSIGFLASTVEEAAGRAHPEKRLIEDAKAAADTSVVRGAHGIPKLTGFRRAAGSEWPSRSVIQTVRDPGSEAAVPDPLIEAATARADLVAMADTLPERRGAVFAPRRSLSEPDAQPLSRMRIPKWVSTAADPFAAALDLGNPEDARKLTLQEFIMPFEAGRVTSLFNQGRVHPAIDLAGPLGTPVHATSNGQRVIFAGWRGGYGNAVMAQDAQGRVHLYGHLRSIIARVGAVLSQGQRLGLLGSTGHSTGPHVHYEVRTRGGGHINPVTLLFPGRKVSTGLAWNTSRFMAGFALNTTDQPRAR